LEKFESEPGQGSLSCSVISRPHSALLEKIPFRGQNVEITFNRRGCPIGRIPPAYQFTIADWLHFMA